MKICCNDMRAYVAATGLHNLALMPCGNIAFSEEDGQSTLSMLDVGYLTTLSPHPSLEEGVALARPAYDKMFADVLGVEQGPLPNLETSRIAPALQTVPGPCQGRVGSQDGILFQQLIMLAPDCPKM